VSAAGAVPPLQDRVVVVIGGSSGIGLACATEAARHGARVTVAARGSGPLRDAVAAIGPTARAVVLDVADEGAVEDLFASHEQVDHVVVVAGGPVSAPLLSTGIARQREVMDVRFWGAVHACKLAAPRLHPHGSITLCSGAATARPQPGRPVGVAAGAAVEGLVRALAVELGPARVNAIAPGPTRTGAFDHHFGERADQAAAALTRRLPVGRMGQAADLAHAVLFLMSNPFVTGITLRVDGGYVVG
jgi:NAD(P)-dependent dehydrogenase (short-subunit alcohol dehydrogenase family)